MEAGLTVMAECEFFEGVGEISLFWYFKSEKLRGIFLSETMNRDLTISRKIGLNMTVNRHDQGRYIVCEVQHHSLSSRNTSLIIEVECKRLL